MKRLALLAAVAGLAVSAASAQTVASTGHNGLDPASGKAPTKAVIMFHGYTQKAENMKPIADAVAARVPEAVFIFDNAPVVSGQGFGWYNMRADDPTGKAAAKELALKAVKDVEATWKIKPENIVVVGFSQGGGIALDAGICSTPNVKAVVSLAGVLESTCPKPAGAKATEILIVRNDQDRTVNAERIKAFEDAVVAAGYTSSKKEFPGTAHWPVEDGIKVAVDFIVTQLGGK